MPATDFSFDVHVFPGMDLELGSGYDPGRPQDLGLPTALSDKSLSESQENPQSGSFSLTSEIELEDRSIKSSNASQLTASAYASFVSGHIRVGGSYASASSEERSHQGVRWTLGVQKYAGFDRQLTDEIEPRNAAARLLEDAGRAQFYEDYGSHYVSRVHRAYQMQLTLVIKASKEISTQEVISALQISAAYGPGEAKLNASEKEKLDRVLSHSSARLRIEGGGGGSTGGSLGELVTVRSAEDVSKAMESAKALLSTYDNYANSQPVGVSVEPWRTVFPELHKAPTIRDFANRDAAMVGLYQEYERAERILQDINWYLTSGATLTNPQRACLEKMRQVQSAFQDRVFDLAQTASTADRSDTELFRRAQLFVRDRSFDVDGKTTVAPTEVFFPARESRDVPRVIAFSMEQIAVGEHRPAVQGKSGNILVEARDDRGTTTQLESQITLNRGIQRPNTSAILRTADVRGIKLVLRDVSASGIRIRSQHSTDRIDLQRDLLPAFNHLAFGLALDDGVVDRLQQQSVSIDTDEDCLFWRASWVLDHTSYDVQQEATGSIVVRIQEVPSGNADRFAQQCELLGVD